MASLLRIELPADEKASKGPLPLAMLAVAALAIVTTIVIDLSDPLPMAKLRGIEADQLKREQRNAKFEDGSAARFIEKTVRMRSRTRSIVGPYWSAFLLRYGRNAPQNVVVGKDGWLFMRDRIQLDPDVERDGPDATAHLIGAVRRRLAGVGTDLCVVPISRKAVQCLDQLPTGMDPTPAFDDRVLDAILATGTPMVDVRDVWADLPSGERYQKLDTHWMPTGEKSVADAVVAMFPEHHRTQHEAHTIMGPYDGPRALLHHAGVPLTHPAAAWIEQEPIGRARLRPKSVAARFRKPLRDAPVLMAGTSFFEGSDVVVHLVAGFGRDVGNLSTGGAPILGSLTRLLREDGELLLPELLVLEFPLHLTTCSSSAARATGEVLGTFARDLSVPVMPIAGIETYSLTSTDRTPLGRARLTVPSRVLLSSGDGVLSLRVRTNGEAKQAWRVETSGNPTTLFFETGEGLALVPLIEGPKTGRSVRLVPLNGAAAKADVSVEVVTDADLAALRSLEAGDEDGWYVPRSGASAVAAEDTLVLTWKGPCKTLKLSAVGEDAEGEPQRIYWRFDAPQSKTSVLSLGSLQGGTLTKFRVDGAETVTSIGIAPQARD